MRNQKTLLLLLLLSCICQASQERERIFPRNFMTFPGEDISTEAKFTWEWITVNSGRFKFLTIEEGTAELPADNDITVKENMRIKPYLYLAVANFSGFNHHLFAIRPYTSDNGDGTTTTFNVVTLKRYDKVEDLYSHFDSYNVLPINLEFAFLPQDLVGTRNFTSGLTNKTLFYQRYIKMDNRIISSLAITLEEYDQIDDSD